jgi:hypothetical protein
MTKQKRIGIGKRNEFVVWAKLLVSGIDVYPSLVDVKGIDGLVGYNGRYHEVQIKSGANWGGQRGISYDICKKNPKRIFIVYNYAEEKMIFLTGKQILQETEWRRAIRYELSQLKWNKKLLQKYESRDFNALVRYIKGR